MGCYRSPSRPHFSVGAPHHRPLSVSGRRVGSKPMSFWTLVILKRVALCRLAPVADDPAGEALANAFFEGAVAAAGAAVSASHPGMVVPMSGIVAAVDSLVPRLVQRA